MKIYELGKIPIKAWTEEIEDEALKQAENLSNLDFAFRHIALMPDVHVGFGMPIGGVLAAIDTVVPNAVGVDIGCGLVAAKTDIRHEDIGRRSLEYIVRDGHRKLPLGFQNQRNPRSWEGFQRPPKSDIIEKELDNASYQLGSLGGGNHFISMEAGSDGHVWIMVHSGSRNFGHTVASHYNKLAQNFVWNKDSKDLAYLPLSSPEGRNYFRDMNFVLDFARENRRQILEDFYRIFKEYTCSEEILDQVSCHHNYASREEHFGREVIVHRKGAIKASKGLRAIIPGSMGTSSYIVGGLGNQESFESCSHGAGRDMSRKEANKAIDREDFRKSMRGIVYKEGKDLSEAPQAYKDIDQVMEDQKDLCEILVELRPLGVIKA